MSRLEEIIQTVTANGMREITVERAKQIATEYANYLIIEKVDQQINHLHKKAKSEKGSLKKKYEDSVTSFVVFKMKLKEEI